MNLYLDTAPTEEPLSLDEVKAHLHLTHGDEDNHLLRLIGSARFWGEAVTGRAFVTQKWILKLPAFPLRIELPKSPTSVVNSVKYLDTDGVTERTLSPSLYLVTGLGSDSGRTRIEPAYGTTWPTAHLVEDAVRVLFTCGFGAEAAVPDGIKAALRIHVSEAFRNREHPNFSEAASAIWPWVDLRFD